MTTDKPLPITKVMVWKAYRTRSGVVTPRRRTACLMADR